MPRSASIASVATGHRARRNNTSGLPSDFHPDEGYGSHVVGDYHSANVKAYIHHRNNPWLYSAAAEWQDNAEWNAAQQRKMVSSRSRHENAPVWTRLHRQGPRQGRDLVPAEGTTEPTFAPTIIGPSGQLVPSSGNVASNYWEDRLYNTAAQLALRKRAQHVDPKTSDEMKQLVEHCTFHPQTTKMQGFIAESSNSEEVFNRLNEHAKLVQQRRERDYTDEQVAKYTFRPQITPFNYGANNGGDPTARLYEDALERRQKQKKTESEIEREVQRRFAFRPNADLPHHNESIRPRFMDPKPEPRPPQLKYPFKPNVNRARSVTPSRSRSQTPQAASSPSRSYKPRNTTPMPTRVTRVGTTPPRARTRSRTPTAEARRRVVKSSKPAEPVERKRAPPTAAQKQKEPEQTVRRASPPRASPPRASSSARQQSAAPRQSPSRTAPLRQVTQSSPHRSVPKDDTTPRASETTEEDLGEYSTVVGDSSSASDNSEPDTPKRTTVRSYREIDVATVDAGVNATSFQTQSTSRYGLHWHGEPGSDDSDFVRRE